METIGREVVIENEMGLHARSAAKIVQISERFDSQISLCRDGNVADGKSILDILTLACPKGSVIRVEATGPDAEQAIREITGLILRGFEEK
ncbi:MAG: HPr family phosphocarrier protein [Deltaproteobacteria bacterium]|nr:HPr family phosphocarrier protein [Deltaproteobacteria bacterium]